MAAGLAKPSCPPPYRALHHRPGADAEVSTLGYLLEKRSGIIGWVLGPLDDGAVLDAGSVRWGRCIRPRCREVLCRDLAHCDADDWAALVCCAAALAGLDFCAVGRTDYDPVGFVA